MWCLFKITVSGEQMFSVGLFLVDMIVLVYYYAALLPRRGPHIASHSVCPSVCLSVRPVIVAIGYVFSAPLASRRAT